MFSFARDAWAVLTASMRRRCSWASSPTSGWLWTAKALAARRYRPSTASPDGLRTSVLVPVYDEPEDICRRALASVVANRPCELMAMVDGGDAGIARIAAEYCDRVLRIPKGGSAWPSRRACAPATRRRTS